jgi:hypothetical protein
MSQPIVAVFADGGRQLGAARADASSHGLQIRETLIRLERHEHRNRTAAIRDDHAATFADIVEQAREVLPRFSNASHAHV